MTTIEHIGLTVPDMERAVSFFTEGLGYRRVDSLGSWSDRDGTWMEDNLAVHPRAEIRDIVILRTPGGPNLELFQWKAPEQRESPPPASDVGAAHIGIYVDDVVAASKAIVRAGARPLGKPKPAVGAPEGSEAVYLHFLSPWGQMVELVNYLDGRAAAK